MPEALATAASPPPSDQKRARLETLDKFFRTWLKVDLVPLAAVLAMAGASPAAVRHVKRLARSEAAEGLVRQLLSINPYAIMSSLQMIDRIPFMVGRVMDLVQRLQSWTVQFFTSTAVIGAGDPLAADVIDWLTLNVLERQNTRFVTASSPLGSSTSWNGRSYRDDRSIPGLTPEVWYEPALGTHWFFYHGNVIFVQRDYTRGALSRNNIEAPLGIEPVLVTCLGRSTAPIKRFLEECRAHAKTQYGTCATVYTCRGDDRWSSGIVGAGRTLDTVHLDEAVKADLVADITRYLQPQTRKYYAERGIPYRRGYLLHGPPGTGKSSLSLALATHFNLDLLFLSLPAVRGDEQLESLFSRLPAQCIILLEDVDAVGLRNDHAAEDAAKDAKTTKCTLSGFLNVLDGVNAQQGRVVVMTTNHPDRLDPALTRPGRIDKTVLLSHSGPQAARDLFLRLYKPGRHHEGPSPGSSQGIRDQADAFAARIPENAFTPAALQGYLLRHRDAPADAVSQVGAWVQAELEEAARKKRLVDKEDENKEQQHKEEKPQRPSPEEKAPLPLGFLSRLSSLYPSTMNT